eukprot:CAMPEP_0116906768 /NCGR_PEP_ID=MMETSP0467-20121206/12711_1 /TAXON_ID=283647 /ORGANISM="Mesodinium pulex, Strain SPMC105" /LENGTH=98 /DNA_ID=CAMNT_0004581667 /DNA_START=2125 /DNA_END=2421 /DNA_ORIENTATION=-
MAIKSLKKYKESEYFCAVTLGSIFCAIQKRGNSDELMELSQTGLVAFDEEHFHNYDYTKREWVIVDANFDDDTYVFLQNYTDLIFDKVYSTFDYDDQI